jgi:hypothetical protein
MPVASSACDAGIDAESVSGGVLIYSSSHGVALSPNNTLQPPQREDTLMTKIRLAPMQNQAPCFVAYGERTANICSS